VTNTGTRAKEGHSSDNFQAGSYPTLGRETREREEKEKKSDDVVEKAPTQAGAIIRKGKGGIEDQRSIVANSGSTTKKRWSRGKKRKSMQLNGATNDVSHVEGFPTPHKSEMERRRGVGKKPGPPYLRKPKEREKNTNGRRGHILC